MPKQRLDGGGWRNDRLTPLIDLYSALATTVRLSSFEKSRRFSDGIGD